MDKITRRQEDVLDYIKRYIVEHGYPPATREIGAALGLSSPATVHTHLKKLEDAGYIKKTNSKFRTIEILVDNEYDKKQEDVVKVPLLGRVACGNPIEAISDPNDWFTLPATLIPEKEEIFTLKCTGESMINVGIYDGDIVVVQKQNNAENGETVVALNEDNEATVKTYYKEKDYIRLQPENDTMEPIILRNCTILGKVIGLYRKF
jgi:repressor LexA